MLPRPAVLLDGLMTIKASRKSSSLLYRTMGSH